MKLNKIFICAALATLGLTSCDKNDPWGLTEGEGQLLLNVTKKEPSHTRAAVDTKDFPVTIKGKDAVAQEIREYARAEEMPEIVTLPVGFYDVTAHTPGDLLKEMNAAYYLGNKEVEITAIPTNTELKCTMANSKISVVYSEDFDTEFTDWEATINDGTQHVLAFTKENQKTLTYWWFDIPTKTIRVDVNATTKMGEKVSATATYNKHNSTEGYLDVENEYFTGGDAIVINLSPETDPNGYITGIGLVTNITFENYDEDITIEVEDNDDVIISPDQGGSEIEINTNYPAEGVDALYGQTSDFPSVQVDFTFPTGVKNLFVKVDGSEDFNVAASLMGLTEGDGLDLTSSAAEELSTLFPLPTVGSKTYQFSLSDEIWNLLTAAPGYPGKQVFTLKAVDKNGMEKTGELIINIYEGEIPSKGIKITTNYGAEGVTAQYGQTSDFPSVQVDFEFPTGVKNLFVKVDGSEDFNVAASLMGLTEGDGLDLTSSEAEELSSLFPLPTVGSKTYQFSLSDEIWNLLATAPGYVGTHVFTLKAVDQNGETKNGQLIIKIEE